MPELIIEIVDGRVKVTADGTPQSCKAADEVEAALGKVTKKVNTGMKPVTSSVRAK